jgi:hypothetical protein
MRSLKQLDCAYYISESVHVILFVVTHLGWPVCLPAASSRAQL